eukprot:CAMPEP_0197646154 /NCGR_PEP_ID=MMETSP1338-20131121/22043_1 /TAXON_ID=43686 ORGANISM="Pelagodinium beii, Strain RCC1491" /NCGR_SAMPLE_ID=MMETSP1338 /ASSEMBLY_ACC=CAM_ASM_000754 /LENGTH=55 /DNA_ID=CAMNT_0043219751 /DNA_START=71 /DNA_END=235 /DNA_ORIENTATION=+
MAGSKFLAPAAAVIAVGALSSCFLVGAPPQPAPQTPSVGGAFTQAEAGLPFDFEE